LKFESIFFINDIIPSILRHIDIIGINEYKIYSPDEFNLLLKNYNVFKNDLVQIALSKNVFVYHQRDVWIEVDKKY